MEKDFVTFDSKALAITVKFDDKKDLVIKKDDLQISYFSRGHGGQNVNRHMNGVRLIYHMPESHLLAFKKTKELVTACIGGRSLDKNMRRAFEQLAHKIQNYFYVPPVRKNTKVPKKSKEKRLRNKKNRSQVKALRKSPKIDL